MLANHNSSQVVISGEIDAVRLASDRLSDVGARRVTPLNVSGAFHSPLLAEAAAEFAAELEATEFQDPRAPLVANVSARPVVRADELKAGLKRQLTSPVLWHDTVAWLADGQPPAPRVMLEVGPGKVLASLARREHRELTFLAGGTREDLDGLRDRLAAVVEPSAERKEESS